MNKTYKYKIPFEMPPFPEHHFENMIFEVKDYVTEGAEKQTIQRAVNACADAGGGMSGGVRNVYAANCRIAGTNQGIRLKSMRGRGGYVRDVWFEDIQIDGTTQEAAMEIRGLPEKKLKSLELSDILLFAPKPLICDDAENISMNNVVLGYKK